MTSPHCSDRNFYFKTGRGPTNLPGHVSRQKMNGTVTVLPCFKDFARAVNWLESNMKLLTLIPVPP